MDDQDFTVSLTQSQELFDQGKREGEAEYLSPSKYARKKVGSEWAAAASSSKQKGNALNATLEEALS